MKYIFNDKIILTGEVLHHSNIDELRSLNETCDRGTKGLLVRLSLVDDHIDLQDTHAHSESNTNLLSLLHLEFPEDKPRKKSKDKVHASGVSYVQR